MSDEVEEKVVSISSKLIKDVRELNVYKRSYQASLDIHKATLAFPKIEQFALADQLRRSSKSVCANLAEGFGKQTYSSAEFGRFIAMAEGSTVEVRTWLQYALDLSYIQIPQYQSWDEDYVAIKSMLYNLRKKL